MKKKKMLPITTNIPVYTYTYYGYPNSIVAAEEYAGDYLAKVELFGYRDYDWRENLQNFRVNAEDNCIELFSNHPYRQNLHGIIFRELREIDSVRIRIHYQQYSHPWGAANLFIAEGGEDELLLGDNDYLCRLGYFNREGVYFRVKNEPQKLEYNMRSFPVDLMLCRDHNYIEAYLFDGQDRYLLCQCKQNGLEDRSFQIGFQFRGNESLYPHWLYRNFIQISCDVNSVNRPLDFFYGVEKDWHFYGSHYFLDINEIPLSFINTYDALSFIRDCIDEGRYIELCLDQYDIEGREEYHRCHFNHQNLIYGYDDKKKQICMLGYKNMGRICKTTISYEKLRYQFAKRQCVTDIYVIEYKPDAYGMEYRPEYILKMFRQYVESYNSTCDLGHLMEPKDRVFGMACYDELLSERGMQIVLSDRRVLHLLYEHKSLMADRLKYMGFYGTIPEDRLNRYLAAYDEVTKLAYNIRSLALKYEMNGDERVPMKISDGLQRMREIESAVLSDIIRAL